jgi:transcriptional regulator with XRE-family HTH domain
MISKNKSVIEKSFEDLSNSISESDKLIIETRLLMYRFLSEIEKVTSERGISRKELAELAGTSASYITQLYQGKKIINLQMLTRIKKALNIEFKLKVIQLNEKSDSDFNKMSILKMNHKIYAAVHDSSDKTVHESPATGNLNQAKTTKLKRS